MLMIKTQNHSQGFTLIELVMVLLIVAVTGTILVKGMSGLQDATRDNITRERVTQIKQAIINVQTINGTPTVSGFVADVGRLPDCIRELVDGYCEASGIPSCASDVTLANPTYCTSTANIIKDQRWNGPYLTTSNGTFYDGWGNPDTLDGNFGWKYIRGASGNYTGSGVCSYTVGTTTIASVCDRLILQSLGADGLPNGAPENPPIYNDDYPYNNSSGVQPFLIQPSDWIIDLSTSGLNAQFIHPPATSMFPSLSSVACSSGLPSTSFTGATVTSTCSTSMTATSTITCPATQPNTTVAVSPTTLTGLTSTFTCLSSSGIAVTTPVTATCPATTTALATPSPINPATPGSAIFVCTSATSTTITTSISNSSICAVTVLILANDLYGNSIIPMPIPAGNSGPLAPACGQTNTINYNDSTVTTPLTPTPMAVGNWNICAFPSSGGVIPATIPTVTPYVSGDFPQNILSSITTPPTAPTCLNTVNGAGAVGGNPVLSYSPALYSATITVLPRTQPSVAW